MISVKCSECGKEYKLRDQFAGKKAQCKCGATLVVPIAEVQQETPQLDAEFGLDPLRDLAGTEAAAGDPLDETFATASSRSVQAPAAQRNGKGRAGLPLVAVIGGGAAVAVLAIVVVLLIWLLGGGAQVAGFATPEEAYEAQKKAILAEDWSAQIRAFTPESRERQASQLAFVAVNLAQSKPEIAEILQRHGVDPSLYNDQPSPSNPGDFVKFATQMQERQKQLAAAIEDKVGFYVDIMTAMQSSQEGDAASGGASMSAFQDQAQQAQTEAKLANVQIDGDSAVGQQAISFMGRSMNVPVYFRRIDGRWYLHQPDMSEAVEMGRQIGESIRQQMSQSGELPSLPGGDSSLPSDATTAADNLLTAGAMSGEPVEPGKTPESTLHAYYYYADHGQQSKLQEIIVNNITDQPLEDGPGRGESVQAARGVVVDHKVVNDKEAILYFRTWFSATAARRGGRPAVARLAHEDGVWKVDVKETLTRTMQNTKGKTQFGFYDGSKNWWE